MRNRVQRGERCEDAVGDLLALGPLSRLDPWQVGCQMACTFCATGTMGLKGDLTAGEILEQVLHASRVAPIRNVVFMGELGSGRSFAFRMVPT